MFFWANHPVLRISLVFVLGIIVSRHGITLSENTCLWLAFSFFLFALSGQLLLQKSFNSIGGNFLLMAIFLLGILRYEQTNQPSDLQHSLKAWTKCQSYVGTITSFPNKKEKYNTYQVKLEMGVIDSAYISSPLRLLLYEKKDSLSFSSRNYGDRILINGHPSLIAQPKNPFEFDYSRYLGDQQIHLQHFVFPSQIETIEKNQGSPLMSAVYRVRSHFEQIIKSQIRGKDEQAIVLALLLGIKEQLGSDIKASFAASGAMHVLAVSGLHVSIIYFILNWLFRSLPSGDVKRFLVPTLSIVALWFYALLTGFSPSILRAVSMFSIIIFAQILNRKSQVFNSLAFAAFILLIINPFYLFNVGFQLSFMAVAGIVYIYPKIYPLWNVQNRIGDYFWKLICVSIAAQIATFPLSLYYFNQFPTYFLLTNLVIIPTAFVVMVLGIATLFLNPIINWLGLILEYLVSFMSWCVEQVEQLHGSVLDWIHISGFEMTMIYFSIISFFALLKYRRTSFAWIIVLVISAFCLERTFSIVEQFKSRKLIFYSVGNQPIIDHVQSFNAELLSVDSISNFTKQIRHISPYRLHHFLPKPQHPKIAVPLGDFAKMIVVEGQKLLFIHKPFKGHKIKFRLVSDIVIISNQSIRSLDELSKKIEFKEIVIDNSNSHSYLNQLVKEAHQMKVKLHTLQDQAYLISLSRNEKLLNLLF